MTLAPSELVLARCRAFREGDFGFIYDSYHPDSFFRMQFPDRNDYVENGRSSLMSDFAIRECRILKEEQHHGRARVIYYLDTLFQGNRAESFELALFRMTDLGWLYFATQKMERKDFPGELTEISWEDFDQVEDKVFF
jgi:SEC-C motif-containing protein